MRLLFTCLFACLSINAIAAPVDTDEVNRRITKLMERPEMAGLAIAIVEDGELTFAKGYGVKQKGVSEPVTADTVFRWASVSKAVAATTFLQVAEDGHFGLSSVAKAHAPSLTFPESRQIIRVEDILSHQTGLVKNAYDTKIQSGEGAKTIRASLKDLRNVCEPTLCHTYQNVAFDAAAEMIETATGVPYKSTVNKKVFEPLKMTTASLTLEGLYQSKDWAKPHSRRGNLIEAVKPTYYRVPAAAGVNSSVKDLARWMQAQMQDTAFSLPTHITAQTHKTRTATPRENRIMRRNYGALSNAQYGLGWRIYDYEGRRVIGHRGGVQGYRALVLFDPELKSGIAALWNSSDGRPVGLQLEVMDQIYGKPRRDWMRLAKK